MPFDASVIIVSSFRPMGFVLNIKKDASDHVGQKWRNLVTLARLSRESQDFSTSV